MTTQNTASGVEDVRNEPVTFQVEGVPLVGELFLPADYDESGVPLAGVVCAGTWTSVRQQMTDRYAQKLAAEGLAALSFDFRTYGESGGEPRRIESPQMKARDIIAATEFLGTREEIAADRIGGMAVCASAGYMAHAIGQGRPSRRSSRAPPGCTIPLPWASCTVAMKACRSA